MASFLPNDWSIPRERQGLGIRLSRDPLKKSEWRGGNSSSHTATIHLYLMHPLDCEICNVPVLFPALQQAWECKSTKKAREIEMTVTKGSFYLEYDLIWLLTFINRKCHGFQGSTELDFLAISTCLWTKREKWASICELVCHLLILSWYPKQTCET